jgi:hypothetical protein
MIRWPKAEGLPTHVRVNLEHVKGSGALLDLEADPETWIFEGLPWSEQYPLRLILRNSRFESFEIILDEAGVWRRSRLPEVPRYPTPPE